MTLTFLIALISPFREARADESAMISFGSYPGSSCPYSLECVEEEFYEVRGSKLPRLGVPLRHRGGAMRGLLPIGDIPCRIRGVDLLRAVASRNAWSSREF
jgi:hypothetical protein